jgi:hypothetical protein
MEGEEFEHLEESMESCEYKEQSIFGKEKRSKRIDPNDLIGNFRGEEYTAPSTSPSDASEGIETEDGDTVISWDETCNNSMEIFLENIKAYRRRN